jgi:hypothetical protein
MDAQHLEKINKYRPHNFPEYTEGELSNFDVLASNNLLHASMFKWDKQSLQRMAKTYPGKPLILDHQWENVSAQHAFIYHADLYHYPQPSQDIKNYFLNLSPAPDIDSHILETEGLYQLKCCIATETNHPITSELNYGRKINVSIGGLADGSMICPVCNTSFEDDNCPHLIPGFQYSYVDNSFPIAPYWIRSGYQETIELSLVTAGNCPSAKILNCQTAQLLSLT